MSGITGEPYLSHCQEGELEEEGGDTRQQRAGKRIGREQEGGAQVMHICLGTGIQTGEWL